jgi:translation initiation factor IF-3
MFRGRETVHPENGRRLLDRLAEEVSDIARVDAPAKLDGRNMTMMLSPLKDAVTQRAPQPARQRRNRPPEDEGEEEVAAPTRPRPPKITRAEGG